MGITDFINDKDLKVDIYRDEDFEEEVDYQKLARCAKDGNNAVYTYIRRWAEEIDIAPDGQFYSQARTCASLWARVEWFDSLSNHEKAKVFHERFDSSIRQLVEDIRAELSSRVEPVVYDAQYRNQNVVFPGAASRHHYVTAGFNNSRRRRST